MAKSKSAKAQIESRRAVVAANLLAGNNYRTIAAGLDVSIGTVAADVKALFKRWGQESARDVNEAVALDLGRLDVAQVAIWPQVREGNPRAIDSLIKIMTHRARLLGVDHRHKVDISGQIDSTQVVVYLPENDR